MGQFPHDASVILYLLLTIGKTAFSAENALLDLKSLECNGKLVRIYSESYVNSGREPFPAGMREQAHKFSFSTYGDKFRAEVYASGSDGSVIQSCVYAFDGDHYQRLLSSGELILAISKSPIKFPTAIYSAASWFLPFAFLDKNPQRLYSELMKEKFTNYTLVNSLVTANDYNLFQQSPDILTYMENLRNGSFDAMKQVKFDGDDFNDLVTFSAYKMIPQSIHRSWPDGKALMKVDVTETFSGDSGARFPKRIERIIYTEDGQIMCHDYIEFYRFSINEASNASFSVDPASADLILDIDENVRIVVPK